MTIPNNGLQETAGWMHLWAVGLGAVARTVHGEGRAFLAALTGAIEVGTWSMNRYGYLDPGQPWTGGFERLIRPISHLRTGTP